MNVPPQDTSSGDNVPSGNYQLALPSPSRTRVDAQTHATRLVHTILNAPFIDPAHLTTQLSYVQFTNAEDLWRNSALLYHAAGALIDCIGRRAVENPQSTLVNSFRLEDTVRSAQTLEGRINSLLRVLSSLQDKQDDYQKVLLLWNEASEALDNLQEIWRHRADVANLLSRQHGPHPPSFTDVQEAMGQILSAIQGGGHMEEVDGDPVNEE
ncbi:hypothetical protein TREMEDRAFT_59376 [Tremella mesenterica DSM 1558]|uniref:uncharacterized protein n=1 Tax=Tremella mesenterica (strain ATCC 24925 / CBS 8224 / DSM 1558 / NBRC 9311 / NRRL Y-6157 / RJB 2259-6 / UBC 559-6) TaxID=578456 RepID=UPI0003F4A3A4|nr:uncharacterized protein TREMEDRAFT_59376 [Tremella mesenterica DSM 1558]EIW73211.1 hypothetical protein TREMEDRAFT_59376 [Tremella mesenterica DSM 1558]